MFSAVCLFRCLLLSTLLAHPAFGQVFAALDGSVAGQIDTPPNLSPSCADTFTQSILCAPLLWQVSGGVLPTPQDLKEICFENCRVSLETLRATQATNCTTDDTIVGGDKIYPATYITDRLLFAYDWSCVKDSGDYCFPLAQQFNAGNVTSSSDLCSSCNLKMRQVLLESPFGYSDDSASKYSSLTSSCEVTSYPITSPASYAMGTTTYSVSQTPTTSRVTPTYTCESTYKIQEFDTCQSISLTKQVSTLNLLNSNKLPAFCTDFPEAGTELCIPQSCDTYTVSSYDTCDSLIKANGLTISQLLAWNPNLNIQCGNLRSLMGYVICLSEPGTVKSTVTPSPKKLVSSDSPCLNSRAPGTCANQTPTASNVTLWPPRPVNMSEVLYGTRTGHASPALTDLASLPLPSGTWENCTRYDSHMDVPENARWLDCCNPNYCFIKADFWGINVADFIQWNPSLMHNVSDDSEIASCLLKKGYRYCAGV